MSNFSMESIFWFFLGFNGAGRPWNGGGVLPSDGLACGLLEVQEGGCLEIGTAGVGDIGGVEEVFLDAVRGWRSPGGGWVSGGCGFDFG